MRLFLSYWSILIFNSFFCIAQCAINQTLPIINPVCSDQRIESQNSGVVKIPVNYISSSNMNVFSTVGESLGDTSLSLYDASDNLISSNDDDPNCGGCKQSTITFGPIAGGGNVGGLYLILSKPSCVALDFTTSLKYFARNEFNNDPKIIYPIEIIQCIGSKVTFTADLTTVSSLSPWSSLTPETVTINSTTGEAEFLKTGVATIQLSGKSSCNVINNYIVKGSLTTIINHP